VTPAVYRSLLTLTARSMLVVAVSHRAEGSREDIYRPAQRLLRLRLLE